MKIKIKKLNNNAVLPIKAHPSDAGFDLTATSKIYDEYGNISYGTGISIEIPKGYMGLVYPRSSISKYDLSLCNSVGIIDSGYRGEIMLKFKPTSLCFSNEVGNSIDFDYIDEPFKEEFKDYNIGDKIGQLIIIPYPNIVFKEVTKLSNTDRGIGGFGSSGK